ncbi:hypothetical protein PUN28_008743 [Cardiocondyla obscurior]
MIKVYRNLFHTMQKATILTERKIGMMQVTPLQRASLKEHCILVDKMDKSVGEATKQVCHEINTDGCVPLHRAFSVFLFNSKGELLLQKRSADKITFPGCYTNTCCSHPLADIPEETEEEDAIGVRRAAIRRLNFELGVPSNEITPSDLFYLTRIYYQAPSSDRWGEHEIDYILFLQRDDITIKPNPDEVTDIQWVSRLEIDNFIKANPLLTPWFRLIYNFKLLHWWDNLHNLSQICDVKNIYTLKE